MKAVFMMPNLIFEFPLRELESKRGGDKKKSKKQRSILFREWIPMLGDRAVLEIKKLEIAFDDEKGRICVKCSRKPFSDTLTNAPPILEIYLFDKKRRPMNAVRYGFAWNNHLGALEPAMEDSDKPLRKRHVRRTCYVAARIRTQGFRWSEDPRVVKARKRHKLPAA
jgi:hypothetical protein